MKYTADRKIIILIHFSLVLKLFGISEMQGNLVHNAECQIKYGQTETFNTNILILIACRIQTYGVLFDTLTRSHWFALKDS